MTAKAVRKHVASHAGGDKINSRKPASSRNVVAGDWKVISVGSVNVRVHVPTEVELKKRVIESKSLAGRLRFAIARPGIKLNVKATSPIYFADKSDPTLIVKKVGSKTTRGRFNNSGVFLKVK